MPLRNWPPTNVLRFPKKFGLSRFVVLCTASQNLL
jgi:hypothetical protein